MERNAFGDGAKMYGMKLSQYIFAPSPNASTTQAHMLFQITVEVVTKLSSGG